ncbi:MAG: FkbM family methyltransferase [Syntrophorhabdales bacterium]
MDKPLVLYGAGSLGRMAKEFFNMLEIPFRYVVDADPGRYSDDATWDGIDIVSPQDVPVNDRRDCLLAICVATSPFAGITSALSRQGWRDMVSFYDITEAYRDIHPLGSGWFTGTLTDDDVEGIDYAMTNWADDVSRAHHVQFIAWHSMRNELSFPGAPVTLDDRFFVPEIRSFLHRREIFLDGGAHHGEVSLRFMATVDHGFDRIFAVEPDRYNSAVLRDVLHGRNGAIPNKIDIIECALGRNVGSVPFFHGLGYASQVSPLTDEFVPMQTLDEMDIPATFIKLHLEGWELDALEGGIHHLNRYRPLLAVTVYHNRNGLWQLPAFLMKNLADYVFLLRLHCWLGTGCVLYAIPHERYGCES